MSTEPTSQISTPWKRNQATQTTNSEPTGGHKPSWVWSFFSESNEGFVQCQVNDRAGNPCNRKLKNGRTGSTKGMSNHLNFTHRLTSSKSSNLSDKPKETLDKFIQTSVMKKVLSVEALKTALVYFICDCDLPLSITKSPSFHRLLKLCNPLALNILVQRTALTAHLSRIYYCHEKHIQLTLSESNQDVSFTTDTWTSPNVTAFMSVTGHFMDRNFKLHSILLGLTEIEGDHSGHSLSNQFLKVIQQYELEKQILCITTESSSANHQMAQEIQVKCPTFVAETNTIGCMAHIIHLAARDGLKALAHSNGTQTEAQ
ncbi:hypothetical protein O181_004176 [Austropuccinia psidii MF-1]|uniref:BED-type domain-containing protein n=1 Tax=Austropuccinia psidii MF-1 TaxID=1389203 RepID=A0A9Q3BF24_9BASI|nr:hypothetical protein [Austropuccinia psidii MF-1]